MPFRFARGYPSSVRRVVIASDTVSVRQEITASLSGIDTAVEEVDTGPAALDIVRNDAPDLLVLDLQIASMGGMAVCMELRLDESVGLVDHVPVLMLLDRRADVFVARRSGAEGWVVKPLDPIRLRRAARALLAGETYFDESYQPIPVLTRAQSSG